MKMRTISLLAAAALLSAPAVVTTAARSQRGAEGATAAAPSAALSAGAAGNVSWTSYAANSTSSATGKPPSCADGSRAPLAYLWNILYNDHYTKTGQTTALDGLSAVSSLLGNTGYEASGWPGVEGFGRPPSATGPWCDKKQNPECKPAFIFADGGVPQNKSYANNGPLMKAHLDSLETAADLTLPPDWDGVIGFDWEGWEPVYDHFLFTGYQNKSMDIVRAEHPDWTNESQIAAQAAMEFNAAAQAFFNATILKMRQIRPKARLGFYGTPSKAYGTWWNATAIPCNASMDESSCHRAGRCQWCTGPLIKNDTSKGFCTSQHNPCPLDAPADKIRNVTSGVSVACNSGNINERYCYLPSETNGHVIKTVGPPFKSYLSGCCKLCNTTTGCRAWSYESVKSPTPGHKCVLLNKEGSTMHANETYNCVIGECIKDTPSPPGPSPAPHPGPHPAPSPGPSPPHLTPDQRALSGVQAHNDALQWLWNQVDVLMPELYISEDEDASFIRGYLKETERLVQNAHAAGNTKLSIVPFTWQRYSRTDTKFLDLEHLKAEFEVPFEFPHVEAMLVWGDPAVGHVTVDQINAAFSDPTNGLRQLIETVTTQKCDCAKTMCSGNGRCHGVGVGGFSDCQCFEGYSGANCTNKVGETSVGDDTTVDSILTEAKVICPDAISTCEAGQTCGQFIGGRWGCCPLVDAVLCGDAQHCCPKGYSCDKTARVCYK